MTVTGWSYALWLADFLSRSRVWQGKTGWSGWTLTALVLWHPRGLPRAGASLPSVWKVRSCEVHTLTGELCCFPPRAAAATGPSSWKPWPPRPCVRFHQISDFCRGFCRKFHLTYLEGIAYDCAAKSRSRQFEASSLHIWDIETAETFWGAIAHNFFVCWAVCSRTRPQ